MKIIKIVFVTIDWICKRSYKQNICKNNIQNTRTTYIKPYKNNIKPAKCMYIRCGVLQKKNETLQPNRWAHYNVNLSKWNYMKASMALFTANVINVGNIALKKKHPTAKWRIVIFIWFIGISCNSRTLIHSISIKCNNLAIYISKDSYSLAFAW